MKIFQLKNRKRWKKAAGIVMSNKEIKTARLWRAIFSAKTVEYTTERSLPCQLSC
jgi:predicted transcriptional regulator